VEVVWEDGAAARANAGLLLTGDDLKAANSFQTPQRVAPVPFEKVSAEGGRSRFEVPARSYVVLQWSR
jgi:alpha-N-arabinofuranosidase